MAADKGHSLAMLSYGKMLFEGDGIPADVEIGIDYIKKAAENGEVDAMYFYGNILSKGINVAINKEESIHYF